MKIRSACIAALLLALFGSPGVLRAQSGDPASGPKARGFVGGLLGVGFGANGQLDSGRRAYYETSLLFAARGGVLLGEGGRHVLSFELAPSTNRIDWRLRGTATFIASYGTLVPLRRRQDWSWLWRLGVGIGGGFDYRFLVAAELDLLTFNYKMSDKLWVDFGIPTVRFYMETASDARYGIQFVFPLGITFAI